MVVGRVIQLAERLEPGVEVAGQSRGIVVAQAGCVVLESVVVVVREEGDFLQTC